MMKMKTKASLSSSDSDLPSLPIDLIVEILLKLPVRYLLRLKCVCKSWLSLISNPQFPKSHFDVAAAPTYRLLLNFSDDSKVNSIDTEAPLGDDSEEVVFNVPLPLLAAPKRGCMVSIMGSCRGFIFLTNMYSNPHEFVVWNPSTGRHKRINNVSMDANLFGIEYGSSTDDYVVVTMTVALPPPQKNGRGCTLVHCFSLKTNSWSCIESIVYHLSIGSSPGLFLNGALHRSVKSCDNLSVVIAFDVMERRLSEIPLSHELAIALKSKVYYLRVMGECLCLCFMGGSTSIPEIWTMKEYKVQSSWTKSSVFFCNYYPRPFFFFPICFTKNGEILGSNGDKTLAKLDDKGKLHGHCEYRQEMGRRYNLLHRGFYRESLLSLPGEFEEVTEDDQEQQ